MGCVLCGKPIEAGEAWMEAERDGILVRIHSGCLYGEERGAEPAWDPQDRAAT